jgi:hypothetical protein
MTGSGPVVVAAVTAGGALVASFVAALASVYTSRGQRDSADQQRQSAERIEDLRTAQEELRLEVARQFRVHEWTRSNQLDRLIDFANTAKDCERAYDDWNRHRMAILNYDDLVDTHAEYKRRAEADSRMPAEQRAAVIADNADRVDRYGAEAERHRAGERAAANEVFERQKELSALIEMIDWMAPDEVVDAAKGVLAAHSRANVRAGGRGWRPDDEWKAITDEMSRSRETFRSVVRNSIGVTRQR